MRWWKWLGLAGLVGAAVAGVGVAVTRHRARDWHDYEPDELRARLHERLRASQRG